MALVFAVMMVSGPAGILHGQERSPGPAPFVESEALTIAQEWTSFVSKANITQQK